MLKAKTPPKITVQYEGEDSSVDLLEMVGLVLAKRNHQPGYFRCIVADGYKTVVALYLVEEIKQ